ncbi:unnamed protein product [Vitrella brassicaformis CCMP3155]|uniref:Uncharacterized protein n=3 Tax=Vitrella brassicaformis TaxID=1169539 RepID=A0A0G4FPV8_VITBC|nr:unnamed protein product [Vitrella brassicaformis CCMP3155]|eukprot:CEM16505.1 unnamed protein product [Vitrella brassicaformis CCMP3155]
MEDETPRYRSYRRQFDGLMMRRTLEQEAAVKATSALTADHVGDGGDAAVGVRRRETLTQDRGRADIAEVARLHFRGTAMKEALSDGAFLSTKRERGTEKTVETVGDKGKGPAVPQSVSAVPVPGGEYSGAKERMETQNAEMSNVHEVSAEGPPHTRAKAVAAESAGKGAREGKKKSSRATPIASRIANVNVTSKHPSHANRPNNDLPPKRHAVATKASPRPSLSRPLPSSHHDHAFDGHRMATLLQPAYGGVRGAMQQRGIMPRDHIRDNVMKYIRCHDEAVRASRGSITASGGKVESQWKMPRFSKARSAVDTGLRGRQYATDRRR